MRVFAIHDVHGNISELITAPDESAVAVRMTPTGLTMTEIGDLPTDSDDLQRKEGLAEFMANYRVKVSDLQRQAEVTWRGSEAG